MSSEFSMPGRILMLNKLSNNIVTKQMNNHKGKKERREGGRKGGEK